MSKDEANSPRPFSNFYRILEAVFVGETNRVYSPHTYDYLVLTIVS